MTYRTGNHHGVTIVSEGDGARCGRPDHNCQRGHLVAVVIDGGTEGDQALAERICALLNADAAGVFACDVCDKPEYHRHLPPRPYTEPSVDDWEWSSIGRPADISEGCGAESRQITNDARLCDGSGRTCPRHGTVI